MEKKLLITGFAPFGGEAVNPSWEAVRRLPERIGPWRLVKQQIPVAFGKAAQAVLETAEEIRPDVILCIGQAGGRKSITPEAAAINLQDARIPDNAGYQPTDQPVIPGGPAAFFATVPVRRMVSAIREKGLPGDLSYSAGAYVCNDTLYTLLHRYAGTDTRVGFIHVPFLPEQAKENVPSLPLEQIIEALTAAIFAL